MLSDHIKSFNSNILSLREFVDLIEPFLREKSKEHQDKIAPLLLKGLTSKILDDVENLEEDKREKLVKAKEEYDDKIYEIFKEKIEVELDGEATNLKDGGVISAGLKITHRGGIDIKTYFDNARKSEEHIHELYKNSLLSLLSSVEWFFSQILHSFYAENSESSGISKKTLTFSEIRELGSIEDAEKYLIDVKIEEILRSSFEDWTNLLKGELKLNMGYLDSVKENLIEVYQRRNLYVHNGGEINSIYLSKVDQSLIGDLKRGDRITLNKEYLDDAIRKLHLTFILIASELWKKLAPDDKDRGEILIDISFENLIESRWDIAEGISYFIMKDAKMETVDKAVAQVNYWLCKKRLGNFDEVKKEVDTADFSDRKNIFQLALFALREEVDEFFQLLPDTLDSRQLNTERLESFPIFQEMRETDKYKEFKKKSKYFKESNKKVKKLTSTKDDSEETS